MNPAPSTPATPPPLLVDFATVWVIGLIIRTALFQLVTGSPLPASTAGGFEQMGLLCLRFVSSVPATFVFAGCFTLMRAAARFPGAAARVATRALCWAVPLALAFATYSSWAAFYSTRQFMGAEAWALAISSPTLLLDHVVEIAPKMLIIVPLFALLVVVANERVCHWTNG